MEIERRLNVKTGNKCVAPAVTIRWHIYNAVFIIITPTRIKCEALCTFFRRFKSFLKNSGFIRVDLLCTHSLNIRKFCVNKSAGRPLSLLNLNFKSSNKHRVRLRVWNSCWSTPISRFPDWRLSATCEWNVFYIAGICRMIIMCTQPTHRHCSRVFLQSLILS